MNFLHSIENIKDVRPQTKKFAGIFRLLKLYREPHRQPDICSKESEKDIEEMDIIDEYTPS